MAEDIYQKEVVKPGDRVSQLAKEVGFKSHGNSSAVTVVPHQPDNFRGAVGYHWSVPVLEAMLASVRSPGGWSMLEEMENDGAGGKPQFFTLVGTEDVFSGLGWEIISMVADDFARTGRLPVVMCNDINTKRVTEENIPLVEALFKGFGEALRKAQLVNLTGEAAIMKHSVTAFCDTGAPEQLILNWSGACVGLCSKNLYFDGSAIQPGMPIVGFREPGYRCNGGTFFTNLLLKRFGPDIADIQGSQEAMAFVRQLTTPSVSYAGVICRLAGWQKDGTPGTPLANIAGIAHVTGGGVWGKLMELLPEAVGAVLNDMPEPAEVLRKAQELSWDLGDLRLTDLQAYGTLHGGCGMLVVCADDIAAGKVIEEARADGIEAGFVGRTTNQADMDEGAKLLIHSRFKGGGLLSSNDLE